MGVVVGVFVVVTVRVDVEGRTTFRTSKYNLM